MLEDLVSWWCEMALSFFSDERDEEGIGSEVYPISVQVGLLRCFDGTDLRISCHFISSDGAFVTMLLLNIDGRGSGCD